MSWQELKVVAEVGFEELLMQKEYERVHGMEPQEPKRGSRARTPSPSECPACMLVDACYSIP